MDMFEKIGAAVFIVAMIIIATVFGVGVWGFIQFIQWITSK